MPTADNLAALQKAHLLAVPYENLDIFYGRPFDLAIENIYDKIVNRNRGGYCFELNGLFAWLLRQLGYKTEEYFGRWLLGEALQVPARRHRIIKVKMSEGEYIADVGVGRRAPLTPLLLELSMPQEREGVKYKIIEDATLFKVVQIETAPGVFANFFSFDEAPQQNIDFSYVHYYCTTHPTSVFRSKLMVHRPTLTGRNSLASVINPQTGAVAPQFTTTLADGSSKTFFTYSDEEFKTALNELFDLTI